MARRQPPAPTLGMVLLRVVVGAILLLRGWDWIGNGTFDGAVVLEAVEAALPTLPGIATWWGEDVLLANPDAFAFFWRWVAFLTGLCLLFGGLTRPAGMLACVFLAHGLTFGPPAQELTFLVLLVASFSCSISGAGRRLGLDALFDQHFPGWVTWTRRQSSSFLS